jgi:hypothetical protein
MDGNGNVPECANKFLNETVLLNKNKSVGETYTIHFMVTTDSPF